MAHSEKCRKKIAFLMPLKPTERSDFFITNLHLALCLPFFSELFEITFSLTSSLLLTSITSSRNRGNVSDAFSVFSSWFLLAVNRSER